MGVVVKKNGSDIFTAYIKGSPEKLKTIMDSESIP